MTTTATSRRRTDTTRRGLRARLARGFTGASVAWWPAAITCSLATACGRGADGPPPPLAARAVASHPSASRPVASTVAEAHPPHAASAAPPHAPTGASTVTTGAALAATTSASSPAAPASLARAPWLDDAALLALAPPPVDTLRSRFEPPKGFVRVALAPGSFGAFLRELPLAAPSTPVLTHQGKVLHAAGAPNIAAVAALDVGKADLQQCADSVMRLHAEWLWSLGRRDMSYRAASGVALPFARWAKGERVVVEGNVISWAAATSAGADHASFRRYLDVVFTWANTVSLARQAEAVPAADVRPGDFFILPGNPGHVVLVLDLARSPEGKLAALLGQGFMPAQSFQVLRRGEGSAWFALEPGGAPVDTPFWQPFPWSSLRRLGDAPGNGGPATGG